MPLLASETVGRENHGAIATRHRRCAAIRAGRETPDRQPSTSPARRPEDQTRDAAAGAWPLAEKSELAYADYLVAVRTNVAVGAWRIDSSCRNDDDGRVSFHLSPAPELADMIGLHSPVVWNQGAANPVKLAWRVNDYHPIVTPPKG